MRISDWSSDVCSSDLQGNGVDLVAVHGGARELILRCTGDIELVTWDGVLGAHRGVLPLWTFLRPTPLTRAGRGVRALTAGLGRDFASAIERAHELSVLNLDKLVRKSVGKGKRVSVGVDLGVGR